MVMDVEDIGKRLIPHVFLPLKLPGEISDFLISEENQLLWSLQQTIQRYEIIPQIQETCSVFKTWVQIQTRDFEIGDQIRTLQPGQLFALYVRAQNCGLIISIPKHDPNEIVWSTFPASQKNHDVTASTEDLLVSYPASSIEVKRKNFLHSNAFAKQLDDLMSFEPREAKCISFKAGNKVEEIRDVNDTIFISGWLPALLVTKESHRSFGDLPRITKKIRDNVVLKKALLPFRRSGMWTTAKVILNISLVRDLGKDLGSFVYKVIVLRLMLSFLQPPTFPEMESTGIEMLKKVGRRLRKLEIFSKKIRDIKENLGLIDVYDSLVGDATRIITSARKAIDQNWAIQVEKTNSIVALSGSHFNMTQSLIGKGLWDLLTASDSVKAENVEVTAPEVPPRHRLSVRRKDTLKIPKATTSTICADTSIRLFDFERNVLHNWSDAITETDYKYVWDSFHEYSKSALIYYRNDPVGMSRSIITMLKMIQVWDEVVCIEHPLLQSYKPGIDPDFVQMLLVPTKEELEIVNELEDYFLRRQRAPKSCLLEEEPNDSSFSVKFAERSCDMEALRDKIIQEGKQRSEKKMSTVEGAKSHCQSLRNQIALMNHEYNDSIHYPHLCALCRLVEKEKTYRVTVYEEPLPEELHLQRAVVFELIIPSSIACLRDIIYTFSKRIVSSVVKADNDLSGMWSTDNQLSPHLQRQLDWKVNLGSTVSHFIDCHYKNLHPDRPKEDFIVSNGYNTYYAAGAGTITFDRSSNSKIKKTCTLKVESGSQYELMQWAIDGNVVTPNEVLARQSQCHRKMSTSEFVEFGSLRCYNKLQIRNLIRATVLGTLSFKSESVFNLICQTLWQCSPRANNNVREAHEDFADANFLCECLSIMDDLVEKHKDNWQYNYIVLVAIVFAVNVAEKSIDPLVLESASAFVLKCRSFTETWSQDIQKITSQMANADLTLKTKLTMKLVEVNICMAISFGAHTRLKTLTTPEHLKNWLRSVTVVYDYIDFIRKNATSQIFWLVRRVIELGVSIEEHIVKLSGFHQGMNMFLRSHYGGAEDLDFSNDEVWKFYGKAEQLYVMKAKKKCTDKVVTLHMDIVVGNFLVNGCKVSRLPEAIENHPDFLRVFPSMSFEAQPLGPNEAITKHQYNGSFYSFMLNEGMLTVKEIVAGTPIRRTLIPSEYLPGNFPHKFEHGFSHWWNQDNKTLEFFPRDCKEPLKIMDTKCELLLDIAGGRKLQHLETSRLLADIRCPTFQNIAKVLNRLESTAHIHVWFDSNDETYTIDLPRMRLSFVVHGLGTNSGIAIMSQEYEGMTIAKQQKLETLVGLQQGLLLTKDSEKILLVPHGNVSTVELKDENHHHSVVIGTVNLLEPPYFRYDIDDRLRQLKAGETQTGWFYLAYLHAVTSSFIPDPFTGVTGTERAFQVLTSGVCFPSEPFSAATVKILHLLRGVAPMRTYKPNHLQVMETVNWPSDISPLAAHDDFVAIIDDLVYKSNRLIFLFDDAEPISLKNRDIGLTQKAMLRRSCINNGISGNEQIANGEIHTPPTESYACGIEGVERTVQISHLLHSTVAELPTKTEAFDVLASVLLKNERVSPDFNDRDICSRTMCDWMAVDFSNSWLGIYEAARGVKRNNQMNEWMFFLSCLGFRQDDRVTIRQLSILNAVAVHHAKFAHINPPTYTCYECTSEYEYDESQVTSILTSNVKTSLSAFARSCGSQKRSYENSADFEKRMEPSYEIERETELIALKKAIRNQWPRVEIDSEISGRPAAKYYDWSLAHGKIDALFNKWYRNRDLRSFLVEVATTINSCVTFVAEVNTSELISAMSPIPNCIDTTARSTLQVRLDDFVPHSFGDGDLLDTCERLFRGNLDGFNAVKGFSREKSENFPLKESSESPIFNELVNDLRSSWNQWQLQKDLPDATCDSIWDFINRSIESNSEIYFLSDWCPRIVPTTLLPLICKSFESGTAMSSLTTLLGGYAITITREQQQHRIERYQRQQNDLNLLEMKKESSNIGHTNWSPKDRPEWLLFEIENDLLIRPIQIAVAHQMECPEGGKNSLMQMNMGEGKTAVIIPLLALSLANGSHMCRITVLRSLYQINLKNLSLKIGGLLLNRRVYTMPCRRDYKIVAGNVKKMMTAYQECSDAKGVLLTLPEHRLSFGLKMHENALAEEDTDSKAIDNVIKWLQTNVRDVLDESDEILQVKYQIIYTLGEPLTINAGSARWTVTQKLLKLVPHRIESLLKSEQFANLLEFKPAAASHEFPHCRVLSDFAYEKLCTGLSEDAIATGLISEPPPALKDIVLKFLTQEIMSASDMQILYASTCCTKQTHMDTLLILRGLLACGVLRSCLSKRWRVNYGVNPTGHKLMAVPFRAKDVAAERAEFGHPDMAITLTLLSYYYTGLSDEQLEETFSLLFELNFAEEEYQSWIALIPSATPGLSSIRKLSGINLRDYRQKYGVLFPTMRKNIATIDFWLNQVVFSVESKQFGSKIGCSAWDLCRDNTTHPTTGFSGTNETKLLLPRTIQQRDLPELLGTNGKVLENLLRPENDHYEGLERHISAEKIIEKLVEGNIRVLLDVGAIMLQLNNEQVADEWMKQCQSIDAVVFFDSNNHLLVKNRSSSRPTQFELSPWRNRLDRCAIYLDEIHTRGTDLKIPLGTIAVVTLGKGVRKDTLAQGCMRMRKLGEGHIIRFWGSNEVHPQIVKCAENGRAPGSYAVLKWTLQNSVNFMEENFIYWAGSGIYELQKQSAENICDVNESKLLAQLSSQNEVLELMSMYGLEKSVLKYPCIANNMISLMVAHLRSFASDSPNFRETEIRQNSEFILKHLEKYVGQLERTSNVLDEEQERELDPEKETEAEIEPPSKATAEKHKLNPRLREFIITGNESSLCSSDLLPLQKAFSNSNLQQYCSAVSWGNGPKFIVNATRDFERTVIQSLQPKSDDFLRPVMWVYNTVSEGTNFAILLSPFEVNELWNELKTTATGTLHIYGPQLFIDQKVLHESVPLMVPSRPESHELFPAAMTASLDILAGTIYFTDEATERIYCCVAGISPKPRQSEEEILFHSGGIVNCFIDPKLRNSLPMFNEMSVFQEHPERLIRGIIEARHGTFSDKSHVGNVVVNGRKNFAK